MVAEIRQRAIDVLVRSRSWGRAESVVDALESAGLVLVDAVEHERDRRLLREAIDALAAGPTIRPIGPSDLDAVAAEARAAFGRR